MNYKTKRNNKIKSNSSNKFGGNKFILENNSYLSESFSFLPHGRIDKKETGIGATTLELECSRNSIIVQPLKVTASSKAKKNPKFLYFGTKKGNKQIGRLSTSSHKEIELRKYINDKKIKFKKISVVVDSLPYLIDELKYIGVNVFQDYFLLIDEIDSIQKDSSFRLRMEHSMEIYKNFPPAQRALISATLLSFSDPDLLNEPLTQLEYDNPSRGSIYLKKTKTILPSSVDILKDQFLQGEDKVLVALNSINDILSIVKNLTEQGIVSKNDIAVLCGANKDNERKLGVLKSSINNATLPCRVNFITSAYFTGYDLNDSYNLLIVSDNNKEGTCLSESEIYQIIGRSRIKGNLKKIVLIYNSAPKIQQEYTSDECINIARKSLDSLKCIYNHFQDSSLTAEHEAQLFKRYSSINTIQNFSFIREISVGNPTISYLNIDSFLESQRVKKEVYSGNHLSNFLSNRGFSVSSTEMKKTKTVVSKDNPSSNKESLNNVIKFIKSQTKIDSNSTNLYLSTNYSDIAKEVFDFYLDAKNKKLKRSKIIQLLSSINSVSSWHKLHNQYNLFFTESDFKNLILMGFPVGKEFTLEEIGSNYDKIHNSLRYGSTKNLRKRGKKIRIEGIVSFKRVQKRQGALRTTVYKVENHNPLGLSAILGT